MLPLIRLVVLVSIIGASQTPLHAQRKGKTKTQPPVPTTVEVLRDSIQQLLRKGGLIGAGVAVVRGDSIEWAGGVGLADVATGRRVTAHTLFRAGSITKSFVALGILRLQAEGKLKLDDPISKHIPEAEVSNPWASEHPVTIANLLEHTSGYDDMHFKELIARENEVGIRPLEALQVSPNSRAVRRKPGTYHSYSNPGYTVLSHLIEKVSGQHWEDYLTAKVLKPLKMKESHFFRPTDSRDSVAEGYADDSTAIPSFDIYHRPAGVLVTSSADLARLVLALLREGTLDSQQVVSSADLKRMQRGQTYRAEMRGLFTLYGLGNYTDLGGGYVGRGHDGSIDGFLASYRYYPSLGAGYVVLVNSSRNYRGFKAIKDLTREYVLQGLPKPKPEPIVPSGDKSAFTGIYEAISSRNEINAALDRLQGLMSVKVLGDSIVFGPLLQNQPDTLVHTGEGRYRSVREALSSLVLLDDGDDLIVADGSAFRKIPTAWAYLGLGTTVLVLLVSVASIISAIVWGIMRLRSHNAWSEARWWLVLPGVGLIGAIIMITWISADGVIGRQSAARADAKGILLALLTLLVPVGTIAGSYSLVRTWRKHNDVLRVWLAMLAVAGLITSVWLYQAHWLPLALWWW
jgi:CubicO group peptidase (beta-lactamase class C family)